MPRVSSGLRSEEGGSRIVYRFVVNVRRVAAALALAAWLVLALAPATSAQEVVSVSITGTTTGRAQDCGGGPFVPPTFELTRTGDTTDALTVAISWSGSYAAGGTLSPTAAEFAAGSATTTVVPSLPSIGRAGSLSLTVDDGDAYEPGEPANADADLVFATGPCPGPPAPAPIPSPPLFTG